MKGSSISHTRGTKAEKGKGGMLQNGRRKLWTLGTITSLHLVRRQQQAMQSLPHIASRVPPSHASDLSSPLTIFTTTITFTRVFESEGDSFSCNFQEKSKIRSPNNGLLWKYSSSRASLSYLFSTVTAPVSDRRCWNCNTSTSTLDAFLYCSSCKTVQPIDTSVDYFQIFGIKRGYETREDNLEEKYKDWQKKLHPDLVHTKSQREKDYAAQQSALVIDAYCTLTKKIPRARYLLQLEGIHVDEEGTLSDPELLTEMMELRETIEEAKSEGLEEIKCQIKGKLEDWSVSFGRAFKDRRFKEAVNSIQRMIYYEKAIEEIVKKL